MTNTATYTFAEAIERIGQCTVKWELQLLAWVLQTDRKQYSLYELKLIVEAIRIMNEVVEV